jgi:DNA-binding MarR family transcriptional regulator
METQPRVAATRIIGHVKRNEEDSSDDPDEVLEKILLNAHRIAVSLSELGVFKNAEVSVAEWAVLKALAGRKNVQIRELSLASGVSRQRFRKIVSELEERGLVTTDQSGGEDRRIREISATARSDQVLSAISSNLRGLFHENLVQRRKRSFLGVEHSLERIAKVTRRKSLLKRQSERNRRAGTRARA